MKEKFSVDYFVSPLESLEQVLKMLEEFHLDKLYRVDMYGTDNLLLTLDGSEYYFDGPLDYVGERPNIKQEFTEAEIKAIDERYWPFAVEVTE